MSLGHDIIQSKTSLTVLCLMLGLVALTSFQSEMRCHPTISSSVISFSSCPQSFPASGSFPMSQFFASDGQSIRWDGWTASPTRWTWIWANSGRWWSTGILVCYSPWGHKELDTTEWLNWTELSDWTITRRMWRSIRCRSRPQESKSKNNKWCTVVVVMVLSVFTPLDKRERFYCIYKISTN